MYNFLVLETAQTIIETKYQFRFDYSWLLERYLTMLDKLWYTTDQPRQINRDIAISLITNQKAEVTGKTFSSGPNSEDNEFYFIEIEIYDEGLACFLGYDEDIENFVIQNLPSSSQREKFYSDLGI